MADVSTLEARITEEALEDLRRSMGIEVDLPQYNTAATDDAIRHYALGIGDDNPRFLDAAYSKKTRWGAITAPPTFVMTCGFARSRGLAGIHGLFSGIDLHCHKPIEAGTRIHAKTALSDLIERQGRYAGRVFQQVYTTQYRDSSGELLSTLHSHTFRTERKSGGEKGKYSDLRRQSYSENEIADIAAAYAKESETRAGSRLVYFDDMRIGDEIPSLIKGPLTVTDMICFLMGFGYIYVRAHRQWYSFISRHPGAAVIDAYGIPDVPERVHWDEGLAKHIGMPTMYDYGPQRIGWFDHCLSDWMGDNGWLRRLQVRLSGPNYVGDISWIKGKVTDLSEKDACAFLELEAVDQRGRVSATAKAEVVLPRK
ncbi:MAG: MaoC family dehydratase N-terminal domain-containing protein [Alphaproteobacteria bacterium]|nr:MaoC family dehydratase N-terminal domain-containing protein [Alphaproteobacteria bacterium]